MLVTRPYNRENAVAYARKYAFSQNSLFGNFAGIGGNCTNFVSQALYAGSCEMNFRPTFGWYYISLDDRSPSWTGVEYLYNFLINNTGIGPFAKEVSKDEIEVGDIIQLGNLTNHFYHSPVVVKKDGSNIFVAAHSDDAYMRNISSYKFDNIRYIHILGFRR